MSGASKHEIVNEPEEAIETRKSDASQGQSRGGSPTEARCRATQSERHKDGTHETEAEAFTPRCAAEAAESPASEGQTESPPCFTKATARCKAKASIEAGEKSRQTRIEAQQSRTKEGHGKAAAQNINLAEASDESRHTAHHRSEEECGQSSRSTARFSCETTYDSKVSSSNCSYERSARPSCCFGF